MEKEMLNKILEEINKVNNKIDMNSFRIHIIEKCIEELYIIHKKEVDLA